MDETHMRQQAVVLVDPSSFPVVTAAIRGMALRLRAKGDGGLCLEAGTRTGKNCLCRSRRRINQTLTSAPAARCILRKGEMQSENQSPVAAFLFFVERLP